MHEKRDYLSDLPNELLMNIISKLQGNFFDLTSGSSEILLKISPEFKKTCGLIKKFFPQDYSWFYQF